MDGTVFGPKNVKLLLIAIALLVVGYVLLGQGPVDNPLSKTVAPIILVAVYCVLIPYAIMAKDKGRPEVKSGAQQKKP